jgi:hypothetical protein
MERDMSTTAHETGYCTLSAKAMTSPWRSGPIEWKNEGAIALLCIVGKGPADRGDRRVDGIIRANFLS